MSSPATSSSRNAAPSANLAVGARARDHARMLCETIGPRPAGSAAERRAHDYIANRLAARGYSVERSPASFAPLPWLLPVLPLGGMLLAAGSWAIWFFPWLSVGLPVLVAALPEIARWWLRRAARLAESQNLAAFAGGDRAATTLILCAHVDSARAVAFRKPGWRTLHAKSLYMAQRAAIAVAAIAVLFALDVAVPRWVWITGSAIASAAGIWLALADCINQLGGAGAYSPGAHDNASGAGVLLAVAEELASAAPPDVRLGFLFTGAEEMGMHGAMAFARRLWGQRTAVVNVDMVGAGHTLAYVTRVGILNPQRTDEAFNHLLRRVQPALRPIRYTVRSGDVEAFLRAGIRATSLQTTGSRRAETAYHTVDDTADLLDVQLLQRVSEVLIETVRLFEREHRAWLAAGTTAARVRPRIPTRPFFWLPRRPG